jgi:hypothetical protein
MSIEPGAYLALQEEMMELERQWRAEEAEISRIAAENQARTLELQLASTPIDFVAYELYKRGREAAGLPTYTGGPSSDVDIQEMVSSFVGPGGGSLGVGEFGVNIPRPEAVSRAESQEISPQEMDILGSFLRAGFEANGGQVSYNPEDYWREVEKGFIPTIRAGSTRYTF